MPRKTVFVFLSLFFKFYSCNYFCDTQDGFHTCQANSTTQLYVQSSGVALKCNKKSGCKYNQYMRILHCVTLGEADDTNKDMQFVFREVYQESLQQKLGLLLKHFVSCQMLLFSLYKGCGFSLPKFSVLFGQCTSAKSNTCFQGMRS